MSLEHYFEDEIKRVDFEMYTPKILREKAQTKKDMTEKECLSLTAKMNDIVVQNFTYMMNRLKLTAQDIENEMSIHKTVIADTFFLKTGFEEYELDYFTKELKMETNKEYNELMEVLNLKMPQLMAKLSERAMSLGMGKEEEEQDQMVEQIQRMMEANEDGEDLQEPMIQELEEPMMEE